MWLVVIVMIHFYLFIFNISISNKDQTWNTDYKTCMLTTKSLAVAANDNDYIYRETMNQLICMVHSLLWKVDSCSVGYDIHFYGTQILLRYSQKATTEPYPESHSVHTLHFQDPCSCQSLPNGLLQIIFIKIHKAFLISPCLLHVLPISSLTYCPDNIINKWYNNMDMC